METCIATVSVNGSLRQKISAIANAGFDSLELYEPDLAMSGENPRDIARIVSDHGLRVALLQPLRDFEGLPEPRRARAIESARRMFDVMDELGTDLLLLCSSIAPDASGDIDKIVEDIGTLGEVASERNMRVGFEALAWGKHVRDFQDAWSVIRRCNRQNVGLVLDSFQALARGGDLGRIRTLESNRIFHVQIADAPAIDTDILSLSRRYRNLPGQGHLELANFVEALRSSGYDGTYSIEIFREIQDSLPSAEDSLRSLRSLLG